MQISTMANPWELEKFTFEEIVRVIKNIRQKIVVAERIIFMETWQDLNESIIQ